MTPRLLIVKIQSILNSQKKVETKILKHLASEYQKLYEQCVKRLEQCTALIQTNRDYLALDLVESEPALLDTISVISFPELEQWFKLCADNDIEINPVFDEEQVELLQSLYTKDIGQNHPLYRDYRRAMRTHNTKNALRIIATISKINSNNFDIQQEYLRLLNSQIAEALKNIKVALKDKNNQEALSLYAFLDAHKNDFNSPDWDNIQSEIKDLKKEEAEVQKNEILEELSDIDAANQWSLVLAKIQELKFLETEFSLSLTEQEKSIIAEKQSLIEEKKREDDLDKLRKNTTSFAKESLVNENKNLSLGARISIYKKILKRRKLIDKNIVSALSSRLSTLRKIRFFKFISQSASLLIIVAVAGFGAKYLMEKIESDEIAQQAAMSIEQISLNDSLEGTKKSLAKYRQNYANFTERYELRLSQLDSKIDLLENYKQNIDSLLAKLSLSIDEDFDLNKISEINADIESFKAILKNVLDDDANIYAISLNEMSKKYEQKLARLENTYKAMLSSAISNTEKYLNELIFDFSKDSVDAILNSEQVVGELKAAEKQYTALFSLHEMDKIKISELEEKQVILKSKLDAFLILRESLEQAYSLDDYLQKLKIIQNSSEISAKLKKSIASILDKKSELHYGTSVKSFSEEELENCNKVGELSLLETLPEGFLDVLNVYEYDNEKDETLVYTDGTLTDTKSTWTGGYEIIQRGKEYSARGTTSYISKKKLFQVGKIVTDDTYKNERLSKEATFINTIKEEKHSLLDLINLVFKSDIDPMFKAWLESEIFTMLKNDSANSGFIYSTLVQDRANLIEKNAKGLSSMSWLRKDEQKKQELKYNLYSGTLGNLEESALKRIAAAKLILNTKSQIIGFADENSILNINLDDFATAKIYGIDMSGAEVLLVEDGKILTKATAFSPLVIRVSSEN